MSSPAPLENAEFKEAYRSHEQRTRINTGKVASALVVFLMPAGTLLDLFVYEDNFIVFLVLRIICSALAGILWFLHTTSFGQKNSRLLGLPIALLPAFFIAWMIFLEDGAASPYYAGLNLILLAVSAVVHWNFLESMLAVGAVILMYLLACALSGPVPSTGILFNNMYFLVLTGIIVVTGNSLFNRLRFREFLLKYELEKNKRMLEENNQKLVELDQVKSRFFANISHELRTPLTLLLAPLETLLLRAKRMFDEETRNMFATMQSNGMRLLKLINDLLDLVRMESGKMEVKREPVDLEDFARGLASAVRQVAEDKRIRLGTDIAPEVGTIMVDRDKLEKILLNLLFNALKFTPAAGAVDLCATKQDDTVVLTVKDTGMGISQKNLAHVFDRFWQADGSSKRKYQGMGIGLALVKELAEVQGGTVAVESEEGRGTTFTVRLPYLEANAVPAAPPPAETPSLDAAAAPAAPDAATATSEEWLTNLYRRAELFPSMTSVQDSVRPVETTRNGHSLTVLVADDEPDMLRFLKSQLSQHYRVLEAVDGQQAIEKASQFQPDIVLLDMMMPEKDGLQACRELRERTHTQSIPIVLLTARADEETKLAALTAGASDFLAKPFSTTELHVRIKNLVESRQYQKKLSKQNQVLESTIEQLKDTETQLVQTEKLASLGRMSAGIIHEINNPLNFAKTGLYILRNKAKYLAEDQQADYAEVLKDIEEGINRVRTIVSDLRTFTHPDTTQLDQVEVSEVVTASLRFFSHEWKDNVEIHQDVPADQIILANKNKLSQVLVNLVQNSLDALKKKSFADGERPAIWLEGRVAKGKTSLIVRDNGEGIDPKDMDKIFDPFFTTKDVGQGMGLGLSICFRIVQEWGGQIRVRSERGKFSEFTLEFPAQSPH